MTNTAASQTYASAAGSSCVPHSSAPLGSGDDQQASEPVENEGKKKEHKSQLDQGLIMQVAGSFGELVGDNGGNGIPGSKQGSADGRSIADHHSDSHGFTQCPREGEEDRPQDATPGKGDDHLPGRFPACGAKREGGFSLIARNGQEHFTRDRNNIRNDHDGEDHACGQKSDSIGR